MVTFNDLYATFDEAFDLLETCNELNARGFISRIWLDKLNKTQMQRRQRGSFPKPIPAPRLVEIDTSQLVTIEPPASPAPQRKRLQFSDELVARLTRRRQQHRRRQQTEEWLRNHPVLPDYQEPRQSSGAAAPRQAKRTYERKPSAGVKLTVIGGSIAKPNLRDVGTFAQEVDGLMAVMWKSHGTGTTYRSIAIAVFERRWQAEQFRDLVRRQGYAAGGEYHIRKYRVISPEKQGYGIPVPIIACLNSPNGLKEPTEEMQRQRAAQREERRQSWDEYQQSQEPDASRFSDDPEPEQTYEDLDERAQARELVLIERSVTTHLGYDPVAAVEQVIQQRRRRKDEQLRFDREQLATYLVGKEVEAAYSE